MCQPDNVTINGAEFYKNLVKANPSLQKLPEMKELKKQLGASINKKNNEMKQEPVGKGTSKKVPAKISNGTKK